MWGATYFGRSFHCLSSSIPALLLGRLLTPEELPDASGDTRDGSKTGGILGVPTPSPEGKPALTPSTDRPAINLFDTPWVL